MRDPETGKVIEDPTRGYLAKDQSHSKRELEWATAYRAMCRSLPGEVPAPGRLSKRKPKVRKSLLEEGDESVRARIMGSADQQGTDVSGGGGGGGGGGGRRDQDMNLAPDAADAGAEGDAEGEEEEIDDPAVAAKYEGPQEGDGDDDELGLNDDNDEADQDHDGREGRDDRGEDGEVEDGLDV